LIDVALSVKGITKSFPGVKALDDVTFSVKKGSVHAFVGENGAGKSTLMKILYGNHFADAGNIEIEGKEVKIASPLDAQNLGLSIIFQELHLNPLLSIAENIFMGRMGRFVQKGFINWRKVNSEASTALERVGLKANPKKLVAELSVAEKQMVEIAKSLTFDIKILLMDEPSASLTKREFDILIGVIRDLKSNGITVVYISHRLEEIFEICDTVTVIRDGKIVDTKPIEEETHETVVHKMVGRTFETAFPEMHHNPGEVVLKVENLSRQGVIENTEFEARKGEVLGFSGLVGAGRTELCRMIFGVDYKDSGDVYIKGEKVRINSPNSAIKHGLAYLTEDRKQLGLILNFTVLMNISMVDLKKIMKGAFINRKKENTFSAEQIEKFNIRTPSSRQKVVNLSGGNQQKIVVAKWMCTDVDIFIFDEPTRGIDVGAKYEIYLLMNELIKAGKCVILISSELPEIVNLSNRVLIMRNGKITGELTGNDITSENVMRFAI